MADILYLDIETRPKLAYVWKFFKEFISPNQVLENEVIVSFSAIWNDDKDKSCMYHENHTEDDSGIVTKLIELMDEADMVVGHNVKKFDVGTINGRALVLGIDPPSPYKIVDTFKVAKDQFHFPSNSLEYLSKVLPIKHKKLKHAKFPGFELWAECIKENKEAWKEMKKYNIQDTLAVRDVYRFMRPWIRNHPNLAVQDELTEHACIACGSKDLERRGFAYTNVGKYQRYRCKSCGKWHRTRFTERDKAASKSLLTNA